MSQTLLHATASSNYSAEKLNESHELVLAENGKSHRYYVKLRPNLQYFLNELKPLYQMSIYTHGTRKYAESTCDIMDPEGVYFGKRIVSRSDHPELGSSKSLANLLKTDWSMVLIYDDREDVWKGEQRQHLLCAKPYIFFNEIKDGAVNNRPGILTTATEEKSLTDICDDDNSLVRAVSLFKMLHVQYFDANNHQKTSISTILKDFRRNILSGCVICFSRVIPTSNAANFRRHTMWEIAELLGAAVDSEITPETTHLLTASMGTEKTRECLQRQDVYVLHCDWLLHCHWNMKREKEREYYISRDHSPTQAESKIARTAAELGVMDLIMFVD